MSADTPPALIGALSNGIITLKIVAASPHPLSPTAIAQATGLSKPTTYRLLRTLEHHELVATTEDGRYFSGPGLAPLTAATQKSFRQLVAPLLRSLADETGKTAFVAVADEGDCVTLLSAIPSRFTTSLTQSPGTRHPLTAGAPGKAILSIMPAASWPEPVDKRGGESFQEGPTLTEEVEQVWLQGFAISHNEVLPGVSSVAVPFQIPGERPCALALLCADQGEDATELVRVLQEAAAAIENRA